MDNLSRSGFGGQDLRLFSSEKKLRITTGIGKLLNLVHFPLYVSLHDIINLRNLWTDGTDTMLIRKTAPSNHFLLPTQIISCHLIPTQCAESLIRLVYNLYTGILQGQYDEGSFC